jgi:hypothetical protein
MCRVGSVITTSGETYTIVPGVVLLAEDLTGTGHEWQMIGDDPWRRAYMIFLPGVDTHVRSRSDLKSPRNN